VAFPQTRLSQPELRREQSSDGGELASLDVELEVHGRVEGAADEAGLVCIVRGPFGCAPFCRVDLDGGRELDGD
jgi:hypothetical protein